MFGKRQRPLEKFLSIPDFTPLVNQNTNTLVESNEVTVTADNAWVFTALVRGGDAELNVNGTGWTKDAVFRNGDTIKLRATSSLLLSTETIINLYAQSINKQWSITTSAFGYDPDAQTYFNAVEAADGQELELAVKTAINDFVVGCKADGVWTAIKASCILAGARTISGALVPLVGTAPTNFNFVSGDYNRKTGLIGNRSSKYLNSNRLASADPQNSFHASVYVSTVQTNPTTGTALMGALTVSPLNRSLQFAVDDQLDACGNHSSAVIKSNRPTGTLSNGLLSTSRASSSSFTFRFNQTELTSTQASLAPSDLNIFVFAQNLNNTVSAPTDARLAFYSIGESINLALLDTRVSNLMAAIGAAIP